MARVSFHVPESGEKSFTLNPHRAATIGRDPGNDIVLRDAKVSRHHARITFERGFFIIHDLSSANGTFVNGKRVRIAPLTDRAELRLGSSVGRFTEEVDDQDRPAGTPPENAVGEEPPGRPSGPVLTAPQPKTLPPSDEENEKGGGLKKSDLTATDTGDRKLRGIRYLIDLRGTDQEIAAVRDEKEDPLLFFRNPVTLVGFVARLVAAMVSVSGAATAFFLFWQRQSFPAAAALMLTIAFIFVILMLIPRQQIVLYSDSALSSIAMMLIQETRFSFPALRFTLRKPDGSVIGGFQKNLTTNFGRRRWWILERSSMSRVGYAKEESLPRALLRLIVATVQTNFHLHVHGQHVGIIDRRTPAMNRFLLDLKGDAAHFFDRRLAIALAVLIEAVEGR